MVLMDSLSTTYILSLFYFLMHDMTTTTMTAIRITATALRAIIIIIWLPEESPVLSDSSVIVEDPPF